MKPSAGPAPATTSPRADLPVVVMALWVARTVEGGGAVSERVLTDIRCPSPPVATRRGWPWQARSALGSVQWSAHLVTITAAMAAGLKTLTAALDDPDTDIAHSLRLLGLDAEAAVPSYRGLSVLVPRSDPPFTVTALAEGAVVGDIRTSLQLNLPGRGDRKGMLAVAITLYAGSPGAFVDLAADLVWLTGRPASDFVLDQHLTPAGSLPDDPLRAASAINQAIGVLIGRGYTPQQADGELDTQATDNRTDRHAAARLILEEITPSGDDGHRDVH